LRHGAELSDKIVEVIIKNFRFQYERSNIYQVDQDRFKSQIAAMMLVEMTWLYYLE
jgi:hypothetical protein